jgi:hypothetical protein
MTKEDLEKKLEGLRTQEAQMLANYQATRGARQFCEQLLKELAEKEQASGS